jgi:N-acetylneuraminate synthase
MIYKNIVKIKNICRKIKTRAIIKWHSYFRPINHIKIENKIIGENRPIFVIAEIGVNHNGDIKMAKKLIDVAADAGADAVKFQKRHLTSTYQKHVIENPEFYDQAFQYLIPILKEVEFNEKQYKELAEYAKKRGLIFFTTPFDEPSVDFLEKNINPPLYKIASADLINFPLLEKIIKTKKPLILSTGMSDLNEIDETIAWLLKKKTEFAILHCQSTYPAPLDTLNLSMIQKLKNRYGINVGYSGHEQGIYHTLQAAALGANIIERHITLDKNLPGPDHLASLEPQEFQTLVKLIKDYEIAMGNKIKKVSRGEIANRLTLRKSLVAAANIPKGTILTRPMITAKSPGTGLSPQRLYNLIGKKTLKDYKADELFLESDFFDAPKPVKIKTINSKWGLKARFSELPELINFQPQPKLLEFHVSEKDLDFKLDTNKKYPQELYVHAPEYQVKQLIDLASENEIIWKNSIKIIQQTINKTRAISRNFSGIPKIVIHIGGMTINKHPQPSRLLERAKMAFKKMDAEGVEILPENLPPFGWFFGGLWHCNILTSTEEMINFCKELNFKTCLDLSHAWLYCQESKSDFLKYVEKISPYVSHLHIADGRGSHKEGLQIGEGDIPFEKTFKILENNTSGSISWVPEIWQGHLHDYKEFKIALSKLSIYPFLN